MRKFLVLVLSVLMLAGFSAAQGEVEEIIEIDYDDYSSPDEIYNVNDVRGSHQPEFTSSRSSSGDSSLLMEFTNDQKTANVEYRFSEHGHEMPREVYTRFDVYPENFALGQSDTIRIFWAPLSNGPGSSGGGHPDGTNGWSNAIGFSHRNNAPAPDGYNFFSYSYHMDKPGSSGDFEMTDEPIMMDQWNTVEAYIKANTYSGGTANNDGVMKYWINGELAFERTDMRFTTSDSNLIESVGPLGYIVGNIQGSLYYDNHVIAIGGMPDNTDQLGSEDESQTPNDSNMDNDENGQEDNASDGTDEGSSSTSNIGSLLSLKEGWSLISVPTEASLNDIQVCEFEEMGGNYAYHYVGHSNEEDWNGYGLDETLDPTKGYYAYLTSDCELSTEINQLESELSGETSSEPDSILGAAVQSIRSFLN